MISEFNQYDTPQEAATAYADVLALEERLMWAYAKRIALEDVLANMGPNNIAKITSATLTEEVLMNYRDENVQMIAQYAMIIREAREVLLSS